MKILFISRATLFSVRGGDTVQIENTAKSLRKLGVDIDIELCNNKAIHYASYQLIHFFNIIRPADIIYHIDKSKLPFVVSSIYLEYKDQVKYYKQGIRDKFLSLLDKNTQEYIKCIGRAVKNGEKIISKKYLLLGHKKSIQYVLKRCSYLLPNSHSEYCRLKNDFPDAAAYAVVPNAADAVLFNIKDRPAHEKVENTVLCVARFEPLKNQLNVIKALATTGYKLVLAGNIAPNHQDYYEKCRKAAGENVAFLGLVPQEKIITLYHRYKVHVLASWFETTGLSSLEAAACGCNIVVTTKGDTKAYFSDHAQYCDPADIESIRLAVVNAMNAPTDKTFAEDVRRQFNWDATATATLAVYKKVLNV